LPDEPTHSRGEGHRQGTRPGCGQGARAEGRRHHVEPGRVDAADGAVGLRQDLSPTEGELSILGQPTQGLDGEALARIRRRHIGFVFQAYNLFPTLNALENVKLALDVRGIRGAAAAEEANKALVAVGLSHRLRNYPKNLSGGEQQRVAVARALAGSPELLLADEPTAALDSENGQAVMALLSDLAKDSSRAILAVTHDNRTLPFADRIVHIEDGLIVGEERQTPQGRKAKTSSKARTSKEKA
jgi:putative ABC transport system ATP-binding protein